MKIFGIGLSRTGTTSLCDALRILGISSCHFPTTIEPILTHGAVVDTPIALGYPFLDIMFPGSKFILTDRDEKDWLCSCELFWETNLKRQTEFCSKLHEALYGTTHFVEAKFLEAKRRHTTAARAYFSNRQRDFLEIRICDGDGWQHLCSFLGLPMPAVRFPHENKSRINNLPKIL